MFQQLTLIYNSKRGVAHKIVLALKEISEDTWVRSTWNGACLRLSDEDLRSSDVIFPGLHNTVTVETAQADTYLISARTRRTSSAFPPRGPRPPTPSPATPHRLDSGSPGKKYITGVKLIYAHGAHTAQFYLWAGAEKPLDYNVKKKRRGGGALFLLP